MNLCFGLLKQISLIRAFPSHFSRADSGLIDADIGSLKVGRRKGLIMDVHQLWQRCVRFYRPENLSVVFCFKTAVLTVRLELNIKRYV